MSKQNIGTKLFCVALVLIMGGFFIWPNLKSEQARAANLGDVIINELIWMGTSTSSSDEWIELKNTTDQDTDLSNWDITRKSSGTEIFMLTIPENSIIPANNYFLISNYAETSTSSELNIKPDLESTSVSLANSNLQIKLYDNTWNSGGTLIDTADDGTGVPLAGSYIKDTVWQSMERNIIPGDGTQEENWHTALDSINFDAGSTSLGSPGTANSQPNQPPEIISALALPASISPESQVDFQVQVSDSDGANDIDQVIINLSGIGGLEQEMINIGNGNFNSQFIIPDSVQAGEYQIPVRVLDSVGNVAEENIPLTITLPTYSSSIIINELLPNPSDSEDNEFIELYNTSSQAVELNNWILGDNSTSRYTIDSNDFPSTQITAFGYFVIFRTTSKIALNNSSGDSAKLFQPDQNLLDQVEYTESAPDGQSYNKINDSWQWSTTLTPNLANTITALNHAPKANAGSDQTAYVGDKFTLNGSKSSDEDNDTLSFTWNFGDNSQTTGNPVSHKYNKAGTYAVTLTVSDGQEQDQDTLKVTIKQKSQESDSPDENEEEIPQGPYSKDLVITEILPNPEGSDTDDQGEYIEVYNKGSNEIDLYYWYIDDIEGGSKPHQIEEHLKIKSKQYHVFYRGETKLSLNNSDESARLIWPDEKVAQEIHFDDTAKEGSSYALGDDGKWHWTTTPTPGQANKVQETEEEADDKKQDSEDNNLNDKQELISAPRLSIQDVRAKKRYDKVKTAGIITAPPKVLSESYFYIQDSTSGIQVYSSKKDFPDLKLGDEIEVNGKVSEASQEKRILISSSEDIKVLANNKEIVPVRIETGKVGEALEGKLVLASGQLERSSGNISYINDGSGTLKTYLQKQTGIAKPDIEKNKWITYQGIIGQTSTGYRLMPRFDTDVKAGKFSINPSMGLTSIPKAGTNHRIAMLIILSALAAYYLYPQIKNKIKNPRYL